MSDSSEVLARIELQAQEGDVNAQLDAAVAYMSDDKPSSAAKAIYWIRKVFLTSSERVAPDHILPANKTSIDVRAKTLALAKAGEPLVDMIIRTSICKTCKDTSTDKTLIGLEGTKFYRTVWDFIAWALLSSSSVQASDHPCAVCSSPLEMLFVDYHHFVKEASDDLVVRSLTFGFDPKKRYSLLWFNGENYRLVSQEDIRDEDKVDAEYFVRSINQCTALGNYDDAVAAGKLAVQQFGGDPILLNVISGLLAGDRTGICEAIIDAHLNHRPGDPAGMLCKAELLLHKFRITSPAQMDLVKEADQLVTRALSTSGRKDWQEAELLHCDIARLSEDNPEKVEKLYQEAVNKYPNFAAARFGFGLHYLETAPEKAIDQFMAGENLRNNDPSFPLGQAQALIKCNRFDEAQAAIERAKRLNPAHPMVRILLDEVEKFKANPVADQDQKRYH
jgi:tetratricopeptide (TPR) repeat protein